MDNAMDWKAAMSSDIFKEYVKNELAKQAHKSEEPQKIPLDTEKILSDFKALEDKINSDPKLKKAFSALQDKLASDPEYRSKAKQEFVDGVMMLFLDK